MVSNGFFPGWLDANEMWPAVCQSCVITTFRNSAPSRLMIGMILSPSGTGRVPPGRKQFCTSVTTSTSASPGFTDCARAMLGAPAIASVEAVPSKNWRRPIIVVALRGSHYTRARGVLIALRTDRRRLHDRAHSRFRDPSFRHVFACSHVGCRGFGAWLRVERARL